MAVRKRSPMALAVWLYAVACPAAVCLYVFLQDEGTGEASGPPAVDDSAETGFGTLTDGGPGGAAPAVKGTAGVLLTLALFSAWLPVLAVYGREADLASGGHGAWCRFWRGARIEIECLWWRQLTFWNALSITVYLPVKVLIYLVFAMQGDNVGEGSTRVTEYILRWTSVSIASNGSSVCLMYWVLYLAGQAPAWKFAWVPHGFHLVPSLLELSVHQLAWPEVEWPADRSAWGGWRWYHGLWSAMLPAFFVAVFTVVTNFAGGTIYGRFQCARGHVRMWVFMAAAMVVTPVTFAAALSYLVHHHFRGYPDVVAACLACIPFLFLILGVSHYHFCAMKPLSSPGFEMTDQGEVEADISDDRASRDCSGGCENDGREDE